MTADLQRVRCDTCDFSLNISRGPSELDVLGQLVKGDPCGWVRHGLGPGIACQVQGDSQDC